MSEAAFSCTAIVSGILADDPRADFTKAARPCVKASLRVDGARVFCLAMGDVGDQLLQLRAGDPCAVAGNLTVSAREYNGAPTLGVNLFVARLVGLETAPPKKARSKPSPATAESPGDSIPAAAGDLSDLPF